jgi:hypothetical protein
MRVLKTIVATAVIVFTVTTVAMAGVQHLQQRDDAEDGAARAAGTQATYPVQLTERQLERLAAALAKHQANAGRTQDRDRTRDRDRTQDRDRTKDRDRTQDRDRRQQHQATHERATQAARTAVRQQTSGSGQHHAEPAHEAGRDGAAIGSGDASGSGGGSTGGAHHGDHDGQGCD